MGKIDLTGQRYGRLVAIKVTGKTKSGMTLWLCKCDCGTEKEIAIGHLRNGNTKSCGCLNKDITQKVIIHGECKGGKISPEYDAWRSMKDRCYNENYYQFHRYGGRGIKVCERWINSFEKFLDDMGRRPSKKHSLDRYPNPDGDYSPNNCRWGTAKQQGRNKSGNKFFTYKGQTKTQAEWAEVIGIDVRRLYALLNRNSFKSIMEIIEKHGVIDRRKAPFNKLFYKSRKGIPKGNIGKNHHASKPVFKLDKTSRERLERYESIRQASLITGINNIDKALIDNTKSAGGFKWEFA